MIRLSLDRVEDARLAGDRDLSACRHGSIGCQHAGFVYAPLAALPSEDADRDGWKELFPNQADLDLKDGGYDAVASISTSSSLPRSGGVPSLDDLAECQFIRLALISN